MKSSEVIETLGIIAKLMELHGENTFKTRAYTNAAFKLGKLRYDFENKTVEDIAAIEGIGKGLATKICELYITGNTPDLKNLLERTPDGVVQMLSIKGLGPKKVRQLWLELQCESIGELRYACNENRLITLKGFGEKTQAAVLENINFKLANSNKFHYATVEVPLKRLVEAIQNHSSAQVAIVGEMARKNEVIESVELLLDAPLGIDVSELEFMLPLPVTYHYCAPQEFVFRAVELSSSKTHLEQIKLNGLQSRSFTNESEVYSALNLQFVPAELREGLGEVELAQQNKLPELLQYEDLQGILHNHTTYSDGLDSLEEMAQYCRELGYKYLGICDHSRSAAYAKGLTIERVIEQQAEIDKLNSAQSGFRILKGIESDILSDGSLDYPHEVLKTFDFVVASVHSNLKMDEIKATTRLLKAIENPYTSILGHPSGRLLLARKGYPLDYRKIIDACAANKVSIELNAHPYRLDLDWRWIPYCLEKGVMISVNPDAHHREGYHHMYYGVCAARKGRLHKKACLNALSLEELLAFFQK